MQCLPIHRIVLSTVIVISASVSQAKGHLCRDFFRNRVSATAPTSIVPSRPAPQFDRMNFVYAIARNQPGALSTIDADRPITPHTIEFRTQLPHQGPSWWFGSAHVLATSAMPAPFGSILYFAANMTEFGPTVRVGVRLVIPANVPYAETGPALRVIRSRFADAIRVTGNRYLGVTPLADATEDLEGDEFIVAMEDGSDVDVNSRRIVLLTLVFNPAHVTEAEFARLVTRLLIGPDTLIH